MANDVSLQFPGGHLRAASYADNLAGVLDLAVLAALVARGVPFSRLIATSRPIVRGSVNPPNFG